MIGVAYAQGAAGAPAGGGIAQFIPLILIFVVFYFLLIRPQQKRANTPIFPVFPSGLPYEYC